MVSPSVWLYFDPGLHPPRSACHRKVEFYHCVIHLFPHACLLACLPAWISRKPDQQNQIVTKNIFVCLSLVCTPVWSLRLHADDKVWLHTSHLYGFFLVHVLVEFCGPANDLNHATHLYGFSPVLYLPTYLSACLPYTYLSTYLPVSLTACLHACLSACLPAWKLRKPDQQNQLSQTTYLYAFPLCVP